MPNKELSVQQRVQVLIPVPGAQLQDCWEVVSNFPGDARASLLCLQCSQRELPSLEIAARAVVPVSVLELSEMTLDSTDSAPPMDPPVKEAGAEEEAAELPFDSVQF